MTDSMANAIIVAMIAVSSEALLSTREGMAEMQSFPATDNVAARLVSLQFDGIQSRIDNRECFIAEDRT